MLREGKHSSMLHPPTPNPMPASDLNQDLSEQKKQSQSVSTVYFDFFLHICFRRICIIGNRSHFEPHEA